MTKKFLLYDGRAKMGETDEATILDTADSEDEARKAGGSVNGWAFHDAIWAEYDDDNGNLINEKLRWDIPPAPAPKQKRRKKRK